MGFEPQKPVKTWKDGSVEISCFNRRAFRGGKEVIFSTYSVGRIYIDRDGNYKSSRNFSMRELLKLAEIMAVVISEEENEDGESTHGNEQ